MYLTNQDQKKKIGVGKGLEWQADNVLSSAFRIPHDFPPKNLLMLTAYVDETGQEQDDWMLIAGYMGSDEAWKSLVGPWQNAIAPRKHLHMTNLRFKRDAERRMLERAGSIPSQCGLTQIVSGVRQADYKDLIVDTPFERLLSGYFFCCAALIIITVRHLPAGERLEIVFERQDRYGWIADVALKVISEHWRSPDALLEDGTPKLANWRFVSKGETILTEPADYLCYAYRQISRDGASTKAAWCAPILDAPDNNGGGYLLQRPEIRLIVTMGMLANFLDQAKGVMQSAGGA
jgi:hypothetical protein